MKKKISWWVWLLLIIGVLFFIPEPADLIGGTIFEAIAGVIGIIELLREKEWI